MSKLSKLREAIEHLEAAEVILLDARRAFKEFTLEYDKLTYQADRASKAAEVTKTVLVHVEAGIYQAAQQSVEPTVYHAGGSAYDRQAVYNESLKKK